MRVFFHGHLYPNQRLNRSRQAITHQFKFSIRRNKANCSLTFKSRQSYTLVEFNIFQFHRSSTVSYNSNSLYYVHQNHGANLPREKNPPEKLQTNFQQIFLQGKFPLHLKYAIIFVEVHRITHFRQIGKALYH